jgi:hypothetical protein
MSNSTAPSLSYRFSPRATLAALGIRLQGLNLFGPVRDHVHIGQKTITHTPVQKWYDAFIAILAGAHGFVEINKRLRSDPGLQAAFGTNAGHQRLSLQEAVLCYRNEYRVERVFNRLKSRVHIAPLFVKLNAQIEGLTYLLTLGVRVVTVMEFILRRSLQHDQAHLPGLHPENKAKMTDKPTAERILKAFADVSLTIIKTAAGEEILRRLTPLSGLQEDILQRQGFGTALYRQLEIQNMSN